MCKSRNVALIFLFCLRFSSELPLEDIRKRRVCTAFLVDIPAIDKLVAFDALFDKRKAGIKAVSNLTHNEKGQLNLR